MKGHKKHSEHRKAHGGAARHRKHHAMGGHVKDVEGVPEKPHTHAPASEEFGNKAVLKEAHAGHGGDIEGGSGPRMGRKRGGAAHHHRHGGAAHHGKHHKAAGGGVGADKHPYSSARGGSGAL